MKPRLARLAFCLVATFALVSAGAVATAGELDWPHVPGQLLVNFHSDVDADTIDLVNGLVGARVTATFRMDAGLRLVSLPEGVDLAEALRSYRAQAEVRFAEPDYVYHTQIVPDDARFSELWGMHNTGQSGGLVDFDIDAPEAWDSHTDAFGVVLASIDTGVDKNHVDLPGAWVNPGEIAGNGVDDDGNGYVDDINGWDFVNNDNNPADDHSHGTHTMGTATALGDNGIGVAGVTWSAQIMILKGCSGGGSCSSSWTIPAIDYATANGAHLSSNSWGGGGFSQAMQDAIDRAEAAQVLFVAAAGNNGSNNDASGFYPANYPNDNVISVASVDRYGGKSSFSNYGATTVDLGAPGSSILSTTPNNAYGSKSGTSMACPHVAGAVAYLMGYNPSLPYLDYKQILMDSVVPTDALLGRTITGGTLNLRQALDLMPPTEIPPENDPPVAVAGGAYKGRAWKAIVFDGSGSWDPDETELGDFVASYRWDFGDGTTTTTSSPTVSHSYGAGNNDYVVTLRVRDRYGVQSTPDSTTCRIRGGGRKPK